MWPVVIITLKRVWLLLMSIERWHIVNIIVWVVNWLNLKFLVTNLMLYDCQFKRFLFVSGLLKEIKNWHLLKKFNSKLSLINIYIFNIMFQYKYKYIGIKMELY